MDILEQDPFTVLNGKLEGPHQSISDLNHIDAFWMLLREILDELIRLVLRVNHQWPSSGLVDDDAVLG